MAAGALGLAMCGCAAPLRSSLSTFQENREIDKLVNDKSFPTAAEIGLAHNTSTAKTEKR